MKKLAFTLRTVLSSLHDVHKVLKFGSSVSEFHMPTCSMLTFLDMYARKNKNIQARRARRTKYETQELQQIETYCTICAAYKKNLDSSSFDPTRSCKKNQSEIPMAKLEPQGNKCYLMLPLQCVKSTDRPHPNHVGYMVMSFNSTSTF